MIRKLIDEKSAQEFQNEFCEAVVEHSRWMMPLRWEIEKTGKAGRHPSRSSVQVFPSFRSGCYLLCWLREVIVSHAMHKFLKPTKIAVIWETVPNPDPHALLKAVALLFHRRVPLSTDKDLTNTDKTLLCRRSEKS
jgi:hypothetical protein